MLDVKNIDFDYPDRQLLQGVQFTVGAGSLLHVRGNNGAGKTTLLKIVAGILQPTQGDVFYNGVSMLQEPLGYQQQLCYVGHKNGVSQLLTLREHCRFELQQHALAPSFEQLLEAFSLEGLGDMSCGVLSVGQRRRAGLMRLLISNASLWLLDEPLVALDKRAITSLMSIIKNHRARGGCVVLTSHQSLPSMEDYQEYVL